MRVCAGERCLVLFMVALAAPSALMYCYAYSTFSNSAYAVSRNVSPPRIGETLHLHMYFNYALRHGQCEYQLQVGGQSAARQ